MINFFISSNAFSKKPELDLPQVILSPQSWNDWWQYETVYSVVLFDAEGLRHNLGGVKIGEVDMEGKRPDLPPEFQTLDKIFFTLGQDDTYYDNIKELGDEIRENIHTSLNDIAFDQKNYDIALKENVTRTSLLRFVSPVSVVGQFRRLAEGTAELSDYDFTYTSFPNKSGKTFSMDFQVTPGSAPPTNIHVLIGRNGVGKTYLLDNMINSLLEENALRFGKFTAQNKRKQDRIFANLVSVTFSAFDTTEPIAERRNKTKGLSYSYIGLKRQRDEKVGEKKILPPKSTIILRNEFTKSAYLCKIGGKFRRLKKAIETLETDPMFEEADILTALKPETFEELSEVAGKLFNKLSSGHKVVLLTITRLVETLEERSLVILDEPEAHLHPPLLSAFIRALSNLLIERNAVAIIATHSPVVVQEVPKSCCWK
jgi:ABC-type branched-subunit amino acid transport system ATPase component